MVSNPFSEGLEVQIGADASGLTSSIDNALASVGGLENAVIGLGGALAAASAGGIAASIGAASDLNASLTESQAIMGDLTSNQMAAMEQAARDVGKTTTFSAAEAGDAFYYLASAGLSAEQSVAALGDVSKFAQAGAFDLATATDLATDAQSALGLSAEDAAENQRNLNRVMDVLVKSNQLANASVEQFSSALTNKAAAAMREAGIEIEEGASVLATFADQGLKGNRAGTILARTIQGLQSAAQTNTEAFRDLGVAVYDADGNMRPMADITSDLEAGLAGMSTEQKNAALAQLGLNERAQQGIGLMMGNSEAMREYEGELRNAGGAAEEVSNNQLKSFENQLALLKSQIADIGISIGNVFLPHLTALVSKVATAAQWFGVLNDKTSGLAGAIALLSGLFGGLGVAAAGLAVKFGVAASMTSALGGAFAVLTGPIGLVIAALALLAVAYKKNLWGFRDAVHSVVAAVKPTLAAVGEAFHGLATAIGGAIGTIQNNVIAPFLAWFVPIWKKHFSAIAAELKKTIGVWVDTIRGFVEFVQPYVAAFLEFLTAAWAKHGDDIMSVVGPLLDGLKKLFETAFSVIADIVVGMLSLMRGDFEGFASAWLSIGETLVNAIVDLFKWLASTLVGNSVVPEMTAAILSVFTNFAGALTSLVTNMLSTIVSVFTSGFSTVVSVVSSGIAAVVSTVTSGIASAVSVVTSGLASIVSAVTSGMSRFTGAVSSGMRSAKSAVTSGVSSMVSTVTGAVSRFKSAGASMASGLASGIKSKIGAAKSAASSLASSIRSRMPGSDADRGPLSDITDAGPALSESVAEGMTDRLRELERASTAVAAAANPELAAGASGGSGRAATVTNNVEVTIEGDASRRDVKRGVSDALRAANARR